MISVIACDKRQAFAQGSVSDEAIQTFRTRGDNGLRRFARNDGGNIYRYFTFAKYGTNRPANG